MEVDLLATGLGGEVTDQAIEHLWKLTPLPLTQVDLIYFRPRAPRGQVPTLSTCCLSTISENLHLYGAESFAGVAPAIIRKVFARVRKDRRYPDDVANPDDAARVALRPDEATTWSMHALADPEGMAALQPDHHLAIPMITTLQHFVPNPNIDPPEHPFITIPKMYRSLNPGVLVPFLTTLMLDSMGELMTDETIGPLRFCTNLSVLSTRNCRITDNGVRFLGSLQLPGKTEEDGMGIWRLRSWSLMGCWGVTDRSMRMLARWPGLVMLDVRNTSCTDAAMSIFNRTQQALFSCANADFQPCTDGLRQVFAMKCPASVIVDRLSRSLLKRKRADPKPDPYLALHIVPSSQIMHPTWLPEQSRQVVTKRAPEQWTSSKAYVGGGVGQIYGARVSEVQDESKDFRRRVKSRLDIEAKLDKKAELESKYCNVKREDWDWDWMSDKEYKKMWTRTKKENGGYSQYDKAHVAGKVFGKKRCVVGVSPGSINVDIPDREDINSRKAIYDEREVVEGEGCYMMVRMVCDEWETLTWAADAGAKLSRTSTQAGSAAALFKFGTQRDKGDLVGDILGTAGPALSQMHSSSQSRPSGNPFAPSQSRSVTQPPSSQQSQPPSKLASPWGTSSSQSGTPLPKSNPFRSGASASAERTPLLPISSPAEAASSQGDTTGFTSFSTSSADRKRTFGGAAGGDPKRRGMKMFSGTKL